MKIEVVFTSWGHDGGSLDGGVHEIEKPSKKLLGQIAAAEAAGSVNVLSASKEERAALGKAVEPDEDSVKVQDKAMADGTWQEGNVRDYIARAEATLRAHRQAAKLSDDELDEETASWVLPDETRAFLETGLAEAYVILDELENGASYDEAVAYAKAAQG